MAYSTIPKPSLHFNTKLYTGNGSTNAITGVGFQPDWVWCKERGASGDHRLFDAVRGATKDLVSNNTDAEATSATSLTAFNTDGFTLGSEGGINGSSDTFVSWNWKAGGAGSSNSDGSVTSTVSVSTTSGFSIVKYTGTGSAGATIGHGLGAVPAQIVVKGISRAESWEVYNQNLDPSNGSYMRWDTTAASAGSSYWNSTSPTSSVFTVNSAGGVNASGIQYVAYCFSEIKGYSKFGSYKGNGNVDGTFVYTGFKPAYVMIKNAADGSDDWQIFDNKRNPHNVTDKILQTNLANAEGTSALDLLSNGFKIRATSGFFNGSGENIIYMTFAEEPLVANSGTDGVPATAR